MITDYSDPKVTLNQIYAAVTNGTSATLGACVIGPNYKVCSYKSNGKYARISSQNVQAASGISATPYPLRKDTDGAVDTDKVSVYVRDAKLVYKTFDAHTATLTGSILKLKETSDSESVIFNGPGCKLPVQVRQGDFVIITAGGTNEVDIVSQLEADDQGYVTGLVLSKNTSIQNITKVRVARQVQGIYVDKTKVTANTDTVAVAANPTVTTSLQGQTPAAYTIYSGTFYAQYRSLDNTFVGKVIPIAATTDAQVADVLGEVSQQNPLALAVACATAAAGSNFVYFTAIGTDVQVSDATTNQTLCEAYNAAMDLVTQNDAIHGIVPCTTNKAVLRQILNDVKTSSALQIPHFKYLYASTAIPQVSDSQTFVGSNNTLIVTQIVRRKAFSDKRGLITFADGPIHNGMDVPPYCVAAAFAGLRSASYPHAPLSNVILPGIQTKDQHGFTASQLKTLGANGFLRVGVNGSGQTIVRRQLTSAAADDVNYDEQSIVCNIDSICLNLKNSGAGYVGNTNISQELLNLLGVQIDCRLAYFKQYVDALVGPQLISGQLVDIKQDVIHKDRVYVTIQGQPPKPFNRFAITFRMI